MTDRGKEIVLTLDGLTRTFGDVVAVDGLSLDIRRGEIFGFLGPNGAGKTTTISMICGLLAPDAGSIRLDGCLLARRDLPRRATTGLRRRLGLCPQEIAVWENLTCREQCEFAGHLYGLSGRTARTRAVELLQILGLSAKSDRLARTLSGGMKRRLNIALALMHEPEILVLDEPQAGLDPQSRVLVRDYVRNLAGTMTVILTTHDMDEADRLSDRVAIIDAGQLLVLDTPERLKEGIGEGDLLELELPGIAPDEAARLCGELEPSFSGLTWQAGRLRLLQHDVHQVLPALLEQLRQRDLNPGDVLVRRRTLEDVFIALTGRGLRE